jgi:hypothetical protein
VCSYIVLEALLDYGTWTRRWAERDQNIQTVTYGRTDTKEGGGGPVQKRGANKEFIFIKTIKMQGKRMRMSKLAARLILLKSTGFSAKLEEEERLETGNWKMCMYYSKTLQM